MVVPRTVRAPATTPVTLIFNTSTQAHSLPLPALISAKTKLVIAAGASDTIEFTTPVAGKYRFLCGLHADDNMVGTLHVQ
jgi:plastocyanin